MTPSSEIPLPLADDLQGELRSTARLVQELMRDIHESTSSTASFGAELHSLHDTVDELSALLRGGNSQESVISRLSSLEAKVDELQRRAEINRQTIEQFRNTNQNTAVEEKKEVRAYHEKQWQFWLAVVMGVLTLAGTTIALFVK